MSLFVWSPAFVLGFALLATVAGAAGDRRSHFWLRAVLLSCVPAVLPLALALAVKSGLLPESTSQAVGPMLAFACVLTLLITPSLLYLRPENAPGDSDGGNGSGPDPRPVAPEPPGGGIPLPDADQPRERVRDHTRQRARRRTQRRPTREPDRTPAPGR